MSNRVTVAQQMQLQKEDSSRLDVITNKLFIFYLLISANFLASVFSCDVQRLLSQNMYALHIIAIMTLYFSVVLIDTTENKASNPGKTVMWTALLYFVFLLSTHCHFKLFALAVLTMFAIFVVQNGKIYLDSLVKDASTPLVHTVPGLARGVEITILLISYLQLVSEFAIIGLIVYGFLVYTGEQSLKYNNWDWIKFWFNTPCIIGKTGAKGVELLRIHQYSGLAMEGVKRIVMLKK